MKFTNAFVQLRKESKLSHVELQKRLSQYGLNVSIQLLSKWENGHSFPTLPCFFALCDIFRIDNPAEYFSDYWNPQLNEVGLRKVQEYRQDLIATGLYRPKAVCTGRCRPLYLLPVSAGTGQFLDSCDYEMAELPEAVPECVDFGIRIAGDSMQPRFQDGSTVWVQKTAIIENGEIGVFYLDGDAYIKKFHQAEDGIQLISLNPKYVPIEILPSSDFRVFGKVIG